MGLVLVAYPPANVRADTPPIDLKLGGGGATSWNVTNIKPGDSGNKTVTLLNAGTLDGFVTIWISDIVSVNTTGPAKFADYLLLNATCQGLETNLSLPVAMKNFPQSPSGFYYVRVNPLRAGDTATLIWKWELPYQTGNDIQGTGISFTINYLLQEPPPPPPPSPSPSQPGGPGEVAEIIEIPSPPPQVLQWTILDKEGRIKAGADGTVQEAAKLTDTAGNIVIDISQGTRITGVGEMSLERVELTLVKEAIGELTAVPANMVLLSPVYKITGYSNGTEVPSINFDPNIIITINYDTGKLPENAFSPFIVNFTRDSSLTRLESPPDAVFELGRAKGVVYHTSYFAVMTEVASPPPLPAKFVVSNLAISPGQARLGQPVHISIDVANDGAVAGNSQLYLVIDGIVREIKEITVEPGSIVTAEFEVSNLAAGKHNVKIAGLTGEFQIIRTVVLPSGSQVNWSSIDMSVAAIILLALLVAFFVVRRSQRERLG